MRNPINKSNLRRPLKMVLLIFMVFIISNTSISRLSQFVIVNREINRIGSYYKSIGTVQPINKEQAYINEAQLLLKEDSMIDYEDHRRTSQGIIDGLPNTNINQSESTNPEFYDYTIDDYKVFLGDVIFTATVDEVYQAPSAEDIYDGLVIKIKVKELIAGFPDYIKDPPTRPVSSTPLQVHIRKNASKWARNTSPLHPAAAQAVHSIRITWLPALLLTA